MENPIREEYLEYVRQKLKKIFEDEGTQIYLNHNDLILQLELNLASYIELISLISSRLCEKLYEQIQLNPSVDKGYWSQITDSFKEQLPENSDKSRLCCWIDVLAFALYDQKDKIPKYENTNQNSKIIPGDTNNFNTNMPIRPVQQESQQNPPTNHDTIIENEIITNVENVVIIETNISNNIFGKINPNATSKVEFEENLAVIEDIINQLNDEIINLQKPKSDLKEQSSICEQELVSREDLEINKKNYKVNVDMLKKVQDMNKVLLPQKSQLEKVFNEVKKEFDEYNKTYQENKEKAESYRVKIAKS